MFILAFGLFCLLFMIPLVVVYYAVRETREHIFVRTGIGIEASIMERALRGIRYDRVTVCSGYVPTASKHGVSVQGLLPVLRFVGKLVGRFDTSDDFHTLQKEAALESLRTLVDRVKAKDDGEVHIVLREDVAFAMNTVVSLSTPGCPFLVGQRQRTVVDDCWQGVLEWLIANREEQDTDLVEDVRSLCDVSWFDELPFSRPVGDDGASTGRRIGVGGVCDDDARGGGSGSGSGSGSSGSGSGLSGSGGSSGGSGSSG